MNIEYLKLSDLKPYGNNARRHTQTDINAIRASIRRFGFNDPVGIWGKDNIIVEGHGRYEAARLEGMEEVPCIRLDHLSDDKRRAYALAHNKTAEMSSWDKALLDAEIAEIQTIDMEQFGVVEVEETPDYDDLFSDAEAKEKEPTVHICPHCGAEVEA